MNDIPAFPMPVGWNGSSHYEEHLSNRAQPGMGLRDWFAGQALPFCLEEFLGVHPDSQRACAECAYGIADAMLAERSKP
jgi:hypothetical protein